MIELENETTSNNNGIQRGRRVFQLTILPVLSDAVVIFLNSIVELTPNDNFWVVPLLYSANARPSKKQDDIVTTHTGS
jgi:hypothetical protein